MLGDVRNCVVVLFLFYLFFKPSNDQIHHICFRLDAIDELKIDQIYHFNNRVLERNEAKSTISTKSTSKSQSPLAISGIFFRFFSFLLLLSRIIVQNSNNMFLLQSKNLWKIRITMIHHRLHYKIFYLPIFQVIFIFFSKIFLNNHCI